MRGLALIGCFLLLAQTLTLSTNAQPGSPAHNVQHSSEHHEHQEFDFTLLDYHLATVLQLLSDDNTTGKAELGTQHSSGSGRGLQETIRKLDAVVHLLTARRSLGVVHVYDLQDPAAAPLVTALSRRIPTKPQEALKLLRKIQGGVHGLLISVGHSSTGSSATGDSGSRNPNGAGNGVNPSDLQLHYSYPLLRRVAVARLLQLWLLHLREYSTVDASGMPLASGSETMTPSWVADARRDVARTLLMLFRLHRAGMRARAALEFLHISKAAGTSMCRLAEVSGCRAQDFSMGRTCLMREYDDQPRWINGSHHWNVIATVAEPWGSHPYAFLMYGVPRMPHRKRTCEARLANLAGHRWNFFANEYTIYNELTWYNGTAAASDDGGLRARGRARGDETAPWPPSSPRAPMSPLSPPQSVLFEETAARYAAYVAHLAATARSDDSAGVASGGAVGSGSGSSSSTGSSSTSSSTTGRRSRRRLSSSSTGSDSSGSSSTSSSSSSSSSPIMKGAHVCPQFANVAVLRDPAERFSSHLKFIAQTYGAMYKWPGIATAFAPGRSSGAWWRAFAPALFDNYMTRSLGGEAVFAMSQELFEEGAAMYVQLARVMLAQYDVILVLESDEYGHRRASNFGLGWRHLLVEFQLRNASTLLKKLDIQVSAQLQQLLPEPQVLEELKQAAVRYDNMLYKYGALLAGLDDAVWRVAAEGLGEPLPGFYSSETANCGYVSLREASPAPMLSQQPLTPPAATGAVTRVRETCVGGFPSGGATS